MKSDERRCDGEEVESHTWCIYRPRWVEIPHLWESTARAHGMDWQRYGENKARNKVGALIWPPFFGSQIMWPVENSFSKLAARTCRVSWTGSSQQCWQSKLSSCVIHWNLTTGPFAVLVDLPQTAISWTEHACGLAVCLCILSASLIFMKQVSKSVWICFTISLNVGTFLTIYWIIIII